MENEEKSTKVNGVSAQINLGVGSPTHLRFAELLKQSGASSAREFVDFLLGIYENPPQADRKCSELQQQINELEAKIRSYESDLAAKNTEIEDLNKKLQTAVSDANANAENGLGKQLQIEELQKQLEGAILLKPTPVERHFISMMAEKCGLAPEIMLRKLFWEDLQNPMSNNFMDQDGDEVSTPSTREIRRVVNEFKAKQQ